MKVRMTDEVHDSNEVTPEDIKKEDIKKYSLDRVAIIAFVIWQQRTCSVVRL